MDWAYIHSTTTELQESIAKLAMKWTNHEHTDDDYNSEGLIKLHIISEFS